MTKTALLALVAASVAKANPEDCTATCRAPERLGKTILDSVTAIINGDVDTVGDFSNLTNVSTESLDTTLRAAFRHIDDEAEDKSRVSKVVDLVPLILDCLPFFDEAAFGESAQDESSWTYAPSCVAVGQNFSPEDATACLDELIANHDPEGFITGHMYSKECTKLRKGLMQDFSDFPDILEDVGTWTSVGLLKVEGLTGLTSIQQYIISRLIPFMLEEFFEDDEKEYDSLKEWFTQTYPGVNLATLQAKKVINAMRNSFYSGKSLWSRVTDTFEDATGGEIPESAIQSGITLLPHLLNCAPFIAAKSNAVPLMIEGEPFEPSEMGKCQYLFFNLLMMDKLDVLDPDTISSILGCVESVKDEDKSCMELLDGITAMTESTFITRPSNCVKTNDASYYKCPEGQVRDEATLESLIFNGDISEWNTAAVTEGCISDYQCIENGIASSNSISLTTSIGSGRSTSIGSGRSGARTSSATSYAVSIVVGLTSALFLMIC